MVRCIVCGLMHVSSSGAFEDQLQFRDSGFSGFRFNWNRGRSSITQNLHFKFGTELKMSTFGALLLD